MHEIRQQPGASTAPDEDAATWPGGPNEGDWVLVAVLGSGGSGHDGVPVMEPKHRRVMRRYRTPEEAIGASVCHSATRVGGGFALCLRTGRTVRFNPFHGDRHV